MRKKCEKISAISTLCFPHHTPSTIFRQIGTLFSDYFRESIFPLLINELDLDNSVQESGIVIVTQQSHNMKFKEGYCPKCGNYGNFPPIFKIFRQTVFEILPLIPHKNCYFQGFMML